MKRTLSLTVLSMCVVSLCFGPWACSSSSDSTGSDTGAGATAGSGGSGTGATAGSGASAGSGATAGTGGKAGSGGSAGTGAAAGSGGGAGTGGTGATAGTGASAGSAGSGGSGAVWRPFADDSVWNTPIAADAAVYSGSTGMVTYLANHGTWGINGIDWEWSIPVYFSTSSDPSRTVCSVRLGKTLLHIPLGASPSPDSDADFAVVDKTTNPWTIFTSWSTQVGGASGCDYSAQAAGVLPADGDGLTMQGWGGRATGWSYLAGLIRPEEVGQGHIDHALVFAMSGCSRNHWWPANASDGSSQDANAIPQGAHVQLDPSVDVTALGLPSGGVIIARALQVYGAFLGDSSAGAALFAQEFLHSDGSCCDPAPWAGRLTPDDVKKLPLQSFRVLAPTQ
jgi:hypothetical protein